MRPQVITSIIDVVGAPDLLDRSLLAQMPELAGPGRGGGAGRRGGGLTPRVPGQLLDAAAVALRDQAAVASSTVPRMVGPTKWVEAGAAVLGLGPEAFLNAYLDSQARAGEMAIDASLIGGRSRTCSTARDFWAEHGHEGGHPYVGPVGFEGTAKQLLADLNDFTQARPFIHGRGGRGRRRRWAAPCGGSRRLCASSATGSRSVTPAGARTSGSIITIDTAHSFERRSAGRKPRTP